jgi:hypothetical protein
MTVKRAREQVDLDNKNKVLEAKLAADKQHVPDLAGAGEGRLDQAYDLYQGVSKQLPAGDSWGTNDAPRALADGYLQRAQTSAKKGQFAVAKAAANKLLNLSLKDPFYNDRIAFFDRLVDLQSQLQSGEVGGAAAMTKDLRHDDPRLYEELESSSPRF